MTTSSDASQTGFSTRKLALGLAFFALFVAAWSLATFGGFVSKTFLADPITMVKEGYALFAQHGFAKDVGITIWRDRLAGFVLAAALAVPLGIRGWARTSRSRRFSNRSCLRALFAGRRRSFHC